MIDREAVVAILQSAGIAHDHIVQNDGPERYATITVDDGEGHDIVFSFDVDGRLTDLVAVDIVAAS